MTAHSSAVVNDPRLTCGGSSACGARPGASNIELIDRQQLTEEVQAGHPGHPSTQDARASVDGARVQGIGRVGRCGSLACHVGLQVVDLAGLRRQVHLAARLPKRSQAVAGRNPLQEILRRQSTAIIFVLLSIHSQIWRVRFWAHVLGAVMTPKLGLFR